MASGRIVSTPTEDEEEYSPALCEAIAKAVAKRLETGLNADRSEAYAFLVVFSAPSAPLTAAVERALGPLRRFFTASLQA